MDCAWSNVVAKLRKAGMDESTIRKLAKASGPLKAALCCLWHYPTPATEKEDYGMSLDRTNPCVNLQWQKISDNSKVRTQDTYPMRRAYDGKGPQWESIFGDNAADIVEICHNFALDAVLSAPFSIILGRSNIEIVEELLKKREDELLIETIGLRVPVSFYGKHPVLVIRSKDSGMILHILVLSYHGMWFLKVKNENDTKKDARVLLDLIWNAVCQWSGVPIGDDSLFSRGDDEKKMDILALIKSRRAQEKASGVMVNHREARAMTAHMLAKPKYAELVKKLDVLDEQDSFLEAILQHWSSKGADKGRATQATEEYKNSEAGKRQFGALSKGTATLQARAEKKWEKFYDHPEVQKIANPQNEDELTKFERERGAKIRQANEPVANYRECRTALMGAYAVFKGDNMLVLPGVKGIGKQKKELLAQMP